MIRTLRDKPRGFGARPAAVSEVSDDGTDGENQVETVQRKGEICLNLFA
jgi:hypothetical protein